MDFRPENKKESQKEEVIISDPERLEKIKCEITAAGPEKLHILADFDNTLTKAFVDGRKTTSLIALLRDGNYLTADYREKAQALAKKYGPMEHDPKLSLEEKKKAMSRWWDTHFDLLIKSGLNKKDLQKISESGAVRLRDGIVELLDLLRKKQIPLVIISASGVGEAIPMQLKREKLLYDNVYIITNTFELDENGKAVGVKKPVIHSANKDETILRDFPDIFEKIKNRKNVILLGDGPSDIGMVEGFEYDNLIKIGFLNDLPADGTPEKTEEYKKNFDIVLTNDASMNFVNKFISETIA